MAAFRRMNRRVSHLIAGWRTGLSRPVLILQAGNTLNYFGYGLILPFEIIYLYQIRGFQSDLFFKSDKSGPILVLNNTNRDEAPWRLATLPLVEAGFLAFEQLTEFTTLRQVIDRGAVILS